MPDAARAACDASYAEAVRRGASEAECNATLDRLSAAGGCRMIAPPPADAALATGRDSGTNGPRCRALRSCCADLGTATATALCIEQTTRIVGQSDPEALCNQTRDVYLSAGYCKAESSDNACSDGIDNDSDGFVDCKDRDCADVKACAPFVEDSSATCRDGKDNDGDGFTDCGDKGCFGVPECQENCTDRKDNNGDGLIDCRDPRCQTVGDCRRENLDSTCSDGLDNDGNGYTDCQDFACSRSPSITVCAR